MKIASKKIIKDLEKNIYCRLKPSSINGIGVFAIRDIPQKTELFKTIRKTRFIYVDPRVVFENLKIHPIVKEMVKDFCAIKNGKLYLPNFSLNEIDISFFVNHSKNPNTLAKEGERFFALRDIKRGEEITVDYEQYCDKEDIF